MPQNFYFGGGVGGGAGCTPVAAKGRVLSIRVYWAVTLCAVLPLLRLLRVGRSSIPILIYYSLSGYERILERAPARASAQEATQTARTEREVTNGVESDLSALPETSLDDTK